MLCGRVDVALAPGSIRDAIVSYLGTVVGDASLTEIRAAVSTKLGTVSASSVRSYLNLNVPNVFVRTGRGHYRLTNVLTQAVATVVPKPVLQNGRAALYHCDCLDWLTYQPPATIHGVITDPPYGLVEYSNEEQAKLRSGKGGVWRVPPSFDGHKRSPLPRFTVLNASYHETLHKFFLKFAVHLLRVVVPGANVVMASNPLLSHIVASAMTEGGFELRGTLVRLTMTMRGGDRPKNAHTEFDDVSVMPRSMWEPWVVLRRPLEGRVQDNLRKWKTGGFRRLDATHPFGDVIRSNPTSPKERLIAPHPSLKPQDLLRQLVRSVLPLGEGIVLDPFAGSGSTLAAANAVGYESIGVERSEEFIRMAKTAIPQLGALRLINPPGAKLHNAVSVKGRSSSSKNSAIITPEIGSFDFC